mgnify:CR=1 FL=1
MIYIFSIVLELFSFLIINSKRERELSLDPINISFCVFLVSFISYLFVFKEWGYPFYFLTFFFFFCLFIVLEIIRFQLPLTKSKKKIYTTYSYSSKRLICFDFFLLLLTLSYFLEVVSVGSKNGVGLFSSFSFVKENYNLISMEFNPLIRQFYKIVLGSSYVFAFLLADYVFVNRKSFISVLLLFPCLLGTVINIISGSRTDILIIIGVFVFSFFFFYNKRPHRKIQKKKLLFPLLLLVILFSFVFYFSMRLVKKDTTLGYSFGFFDYIFSYFGSPIQVFNIKVHNGISLYHSNYFGYNIFSSLYGLLGIVNSGIIGPEFIYLDKAKTFGGNVSTIASGFVFDFGLIGGFVLLIVFYLIFELLFRKNLRKGKAFSFYNIFLNLLLTVFLFSSYSNIIYKFFTMTFWFTLLCSYLIYWFIENRLIIKKEKVLFLYRKTENE